MRVLAILAVATLMAMPAAADQGWGRNRKHGQTKSIPPGHLPPPGECRVWYDGRPPGHQPPPTSCREAERIAARDRTARVVYGGSDRRDDRDDRWPDSAGRSRGSLPDIFGRDERRGEERETGRAVPRRRPIPGGSTPAPSGQSRIPRAGQQEAGIHSPAFDAGYQAGLTQGRDDARRGRSADPARHAGYRSADRGYTSRYGSRTEYQRVFRQGFRAGYDAGFDAIDSSRSGRPGGWIGRRGEQQ